VIETHEHTGHFKEWWRALQVKQKAAMLKRGGSFCPVAAVWGQTANAYVLRNWRRE
jgi:hypothetical protein